MLATRRADGSLVLALWNYAPPVSSGETYVPGPPKGKLQRFDVDVSHFAGDRQATLWRLDPDHGNVIPAFDAMGRPDYPSRDQIRTLREAARMAAPEHVAVHGGKFSVAIPPQGLVVVELK